MHEFSLAEEILRCALETSHAHGDAPVERIDVEIGALRAVVPDSLIFAFESASTGTLAEGASMIWHEIPAAVICPRCETAYEPEDVIWLCTACGAPGGRALHGDELNITRIILSESPQHLTPTPRV